MDIQHVISELIVVSLAVEESRDDEKMQTLASRLLDNEHSILRTPLQTNFWNSVWRFVRHALYSKKVCQQKELYETLTGLGAILSKTHSLSYKVSATEYHKLCVLYHGDAREALFALTQRLSNIAQERFHSPDLQTVISRIERSVPKELLACPQNHSSLFYEAKAIREGISGICNGEEIARIETRIAAIQNELGKDDFAIRQEIAQIKLELASLKQKFEENEALDRLESTFQRQIEADVLHMPGILREFEKHGGFEEKKEAVQIRLMTLYFSTIQTCIAKETAALLNSLETADLATLVRYKGSFDWVQRCLESQIPKNKAALTEHPQPISSQFIAWQERCQESVERALEKINETLQKRAEIHKNAIKQVIETAQAGPNITQTLAQSGWSSWALGVLLSSGGWYVGAGNALATACRVDSVSAGVIGASAAFSAFALQGVYAGLPLTYAAANGAANIAIPAIASQVSFMGISLGPILGCTALYLTQDSTLTLLTARHKLAWMEYGGTPGNMLAWLLASGSAGLKFFGA